MTTPSKPTRSLWPTIAMGVGILIFGAAGAVLGSLTGNESATMALYIGGFLLGAFVGAKVGERIAARQAMKHTSTANTSGPDSWPT